MKVIILGCGGRGRVYAGLLQQNGAEIAAVAEPIADKLAKFGADFGLKAEQMHTNWLDALDHTEAVALINATPDRVHYETTMEALRRGYHVLLEKPMSPDEAECMDMVALAEEKKRLLMVCHVLRYAPFFERLKELLDENVIGRLTHVTLTENVAYWHYAHSFVRGVFRNTTISSPFILAKSCHDLDLIGYLTGKKCLSVMSEGNQLHFKAANAPEGAPVFCLDGCPQETACPYFAPPIYLKQMDGTSWPADSISLDHSYTARVEALKTGPHGRCVFRCDNDLNDHQTAVFRMEDDLIVTFNMCGFSSENTRTMRFSGTHGDIRGHLDKAELEIHRFAKDEVEVIHTDNKTLKSGHGGGDAHLLADFINAVREERFDTKTTARLSLQSHLMAFASEQSRLEGRRVTIQS